MMTEDEAKQRWCPFVRWTAHPSAGRFFNNRIENRQEADAPDDGGDHDYSRCIASNCMAWEWENGVTGQKAAKALDRPPQGDCGLKRGKP